MNPNFHMKDDNENISFTELIKREKYIGSILNSFNHKKGCIKHNKSRNIKTYICYCCIDSKKVSRFLYLSSILDKLDKLKVQFHNTISSQNYILDAISDIVTI